MTWNRDALPLTTPRLFLRAFRSDDVEALADHLRDGRVADTTANLPQPYSRHDAETWVRVTGEQWQTQSAAGLAVALRESDQLVGCVGLRMPPTTDGPSRTADLGYWIAEAFWGRGIASEAARAIIDFGCSDLQLSTITAHHMRRNPASGRVLQKIGMVHEESRERGFQKHGRWEATEHYRFDCTTGS